jgi:hypothetical protein
VFANEEAMEKSFRENDPEGRGVCVSGDRRRRRMNRIGRRTIMCV